MAAAQRRLALRMGSVLPHLRVRADDDRAAARERRGPQGWALPSLGSVAGLSAETANVEAWHVHIDAEVAQIDWLR